MPLTINDFKRGDKVTKLTFTVGDKEENQTGVVVRTTHDGLVVINWDNGCKRNTFISPEALAKRTDTSTGTYMVSNTVALYHRSDPRAKIKATHLQRKALRIFAVQSGYTNTTEYYDNGKNDSGKNRPAFVRMNEDITNGKIDVVVAATPDIIESDRNLFNPWLNALQKLGISFITADGSHKMKVEQIPDSCAVCEKWKTDCLLPRKLRRRTPEILIKYACQRHSDCPLII
jgi:hypothetical protein